MKINQSGSNPVQTSETSAAKKTGRTTKARDGQPAGKTDGAKAEISPRAREAATAKAVASDAPDVREAKIAELKRRIDAGNYKLDATAVADRMVNEDIQLFGN